VYTWNPKDDTFQYAGRSDILSRVSAKTGMSLSDLEEDIHRRKTVLEWMVKEGIRRYRDVGNIIRQFYTDRDRLYNRAKLGLA
jgi:flagellar protein FlaI